MISSPYILPLIITVIALATDQSIALFVRRAVGSRTLQRHRCTSLTNEESCVHDECTWCEFKYGMYDPVCLPGRDIGSLPPGYFSCKRQQEDETITTPTQEPTERRNGASSGFEFFTETSIPSSISGSSDTPSLSPSNSRDGGIPTDYFSEPNSTLVPSVEEKGEEEEAENQSSCHQKLTETSCIDQDCAWCIFMFGGEEPLCLETYLVDSLPAGFYRCNSQDGSRPSHAPTEATHGGAVDSSTSSPSTELPLTTATPSPSPTSLRSARPDRAPPTEEPRGDGATRDATSPSTAPSSSPTSSRNGVPPFLEDYLSQSWWSSEDRFACHDVRNETSCREQACKWCDFKYGAYPSICLSARDITSLPPGFYSCT